MTRAKSVKAVDNYGTLEITLDSGKVVRLYPEAIRNIFTSILRIGEAIHSTEVTDEQRLSTMFTFISTHSRMLHMGFGEKVTISADDGFMSLFARESDPSGETTSFVFGVIAHTPHGKTSDDITPIDYRIHS